jgi:hypothetical protein
LSASTGQRFTSRAMATVWPAPGAKEVAVVDGGLKLASDQLEDFVIVGCCSGEVQKRQNCLHIGGVIVTHRTYC